MNKSIKTEIAKLKKIIIPILKKYGIQKAGIFGSLVRGEIKESSDVDILVDIPDKLHITLLGFAHIQNEISDAINREVDLVEYCVVRDEIKEHVFSEEIRIL